MQFGFQFVVREIELHRNYTDVIIFQSPHVGIPAFIKILKKPFHTMIGVNTLYNALLNHPNFGDINFSELKGCSAGGMALQEVVFKRWLEKTGITISEGYGLSETSPVLTYQIPGKERMGSIGIPIPSTDIQMMDDDGKPAGQVIRTVRGLITNPIQFAEVLANP